MNNTDTNSADFCELESETWVTEDICCLVMDNRDGVALSEDAPKVGNCLKVSLGMEWQDDYVFTYFYSTATRDNWNELYRFARAMAKSGYLHFVSKKGGDIYAKPGCTLVFGGM